MIKVVFNKTCGRCTQSEPLTSGMVGQPIHFDYSTDFDGLAITAVFTDGKTTVDVLNPGAECVIPHEVLTTVGAAVKVGVYAVKGNELVIPTVYAPICAVLQGADPSGDTSVNLTLPIWAQLQAMIGDLADLDTDAKDNLVAAINEAAQTGGGSVSPDDVAQAVADYITAHPIEETDPTVPEWAKAAEKPTYTAAEVGAVTEEYVAIAVTEAWQDAINALNPMLDAKQDKGDYLTADTLQAATDAALAQAKASGAFDGSPGTPGADGKDGTDGRTPVKGVDYWTASDKAEIVNDTKDAIDLSSYAKLSDLAPLTGTTDELTAAQVYQAIRAGTPVVVKHTDNIYGELSFTSFNVANRFMMIVSQTIVFYNSNYILAELTGDLYGEWMFNSTMLAEGANLDSLDERVYALENAGYLTLATLPKYEGATE